MRRNVLELIRAVNASNVLIYFLVRLTAFTVCQQDFTGNTLRGCLQDGFQVACARGCAWLCGRLIPNLPPPLDPVGSNHAVQRRVGQGWSRVKCSRKYNFLVVGVQPQGPDSLQPIFKIWIHVGQVSLKWKTSCSELLSRAASGGRSSRRAHSDVTWSKKN